MIKNNKLKMLISSLLILLPIPIGFFVKGNLKTPVSMPWAMIFLPIFILALHWLCMIVTDIDNKKREQSKKVIGMLFWICPVIMLVSSSVFYAALLGHALNMTFFCGIIIGVAFIIIGNYLPKCKRNHTIGIKIWWTLANEENWNATHRFCGKIWVLGGFLLLISSFLPSAASLVAMPTIFVPMVVIPVVYSYAYDRKLKREGRYTESAEMLKGAKNGKIALLITLPLVAVLVVFALFVSFTGDIEFVYSEESFKVEASFYEDITLYYADISEIELRDSKNVGSRVFGFGGPRLLMGSFVNDELGEYTRYSYTASDSEIIITLRDGRHIVLSGESAGATKVVYYTLTWYMEG